VSSEAAPREPEHARERLAETDFRCVDMLLGKAPARSGSFVFIIMSNMRRSVYGAGLPAFSAMICSPYMRSGKEHAVLRVARGRTSGMLTPQFTPRTYPKRPRDMMQLAKTVGEWPRMNEETVPLFDSRVKHWQKA